MALMLVCTGKKKNVQRAAAHLQQMNAAKKVVILAKSQTTRTKLLRTVEEFRVLIDGEDPKAGVNTNHEAFGGLDYLGWTSQAEISVKISSFKEANDWLKWNIKEKTIPLQARGGSIEIQEETERDAANRKLRICHYILRGPLKMVCICRDQMIDAKLADPKSITYFLPNVP